MLTFNQKHEFGSLTAEIIDLNILAHCFVRKFNRSNYLWLKSTRHHIFEELIALRYMENGLILHLSNLDDDSSLYSFRAVYKKLTKSGISPGSLSKLKSQLDKYRRQLNSIKKVRNKRIAHLNYDDELPMNYFISFEKHFKPLLDLANSIGDTMWGEKIDYQFRLGEFEGTLQFRALTSNLVINASSNQSF